MPSKVRSVSNRSRAYIACGLTDASGNAGPSAAWQEDRARDGAVEKSGMNNFSRAIRLALAYRFTLVTAISSALVVAVLWGGNISVIYPFVEVVFNGQSMPEWVDEQVTTGEATVVQFRDEIAQLEQQLAAAHDEEKTRLTRQVDGARVRLQSEEAALARNQFLQPYIHDYLPTDPFQTLLLIIGVLLAGTIVKDVFIIISSVAVARLAQLATLDLRNEFYRRTLHMDLTSFGENARGDLMNRFTSDMNSLAAGIETLFGRAIREPLKMIACLVGAALVSWRLLILSLVIVPLAGYLIRRLSQSLKRANRRAMEEMSQIYNTLSETFAGIKVVKAFTMERYELRRFRQTAKLYFRQSMRIARYNSLSSPLTELMGIIIISLAILAGGYLALNQQTHLLGIQMSDRPLTLGTLLLFYGLLAGVSDPARKLSDVFNRLQQAAAASDRVYELLDRESKIVESAEPTRLPPHQREICFEKVSFAYHPGQPVLKNINLRIPFGQTVAIVGGNGCGKSTLTNLLLRFFDPVEGRVTVDGIDLRDVRLRDLRQQIGLVTQETLLFDDTVYNNIRYGAPRARGEAIYQAAEKAHAHRFIEEKLPDGYETVVGPGGNRLSGGQRQRIALARAILRDPPILILDEATSQIDLESEQLIHQVLEEFTRERTTIIVTHRLSTLTLADRIVVMDAGQILDVGTHHELLERCEFYRRLHQIDLRQSA